MPNDPQALAELAGKTGVYDVVVTDQDGRKVALFRGKSHRVAGHVVDL
jgi:acyl-CoA thioesterase